MNRARGLTALALAGVLTLAACGDDDDDSAATTEAPAASAAPAATMAPGGTDAMAPGGTDAMAPGGTDAMAEGDIVAVASGNPDFSTLVAAVDAAGLVETLQGAGPFTVFAPTNAAFEALPAGVLDALLLPENQETLAKVLTYHVLPQQVMAADVAAGEVPTVEGQSIEITTDGGVKVNDANVTATDVAASNGVIHVIDAVLVPPDVDVSTLTS
jgi:uncharacterized surface protein with fasciclin (FAS1) repeats